MRAYQSLIQTSLILLICGIIQNSNACYMTCSECSGEEISDCTSCPASRTLVAVPQDYALQQNSDSGVGFCECQGVSDGSATTLSDGSNCYSYTTEQTALLYVFYSVLGINGLLALTATIAKRRYTPLVLLLDFTQTLGLLQLLSIERAQLIAPMARILLYTNYFTALTTSDSISQWFQEKILRTDHVDGANYPLFSRLAQVFPSFSLQANQLYFYAFFIFVCLLLLATYHTSLCMRLRRTRLFILQIPVVLLYTSLFEMLIYLSLQAVQFEAYTHTGTKNSPLSIALFAITGIVFIVFVVYCKKQVTTHRQPQDFTVFDGIQQLDGCFTRSYLLVLLARKVVLVALLFALQNVSLGQYVVVSFAATSLCFLLLQLLVSPFDAEYFRYSNWLAAGTRLTEFIFYLLLSILMLMDSNMQQKQYSLLSQIAQYFLIAALIILIPLTYVCSWREQEQDIDQEEESDFKAGIDNRKTAPAIAQNGQEEQFQLHVPNDKKSINGEEEEEEEQAFKSAQLQKNRRNDTGSNLDSGQVIVIQKQLQEGSLAADQESVQSRMQVPRAQGNRRSLQQQSQDLLLQVQSQSNYDVRKDSAVLPSNDVIEFPASNEEEILENNSLTPGVQVIANRQQSKFAPEQLELRSAAPALQARKQVIANLDSSRNDVPSSQQQRDESSSAMLRLPQQHEPSSSVSVKQQRRANSAANNNDLLQPRRMSTRMQRELQNFKNVQLWEIKENLSRVQENLSNIPGAVQAQDDIFLEKQPINPIQRIQPIQPIEPPAARNRVSKLQKRQTKSENPYTQIAAPIDANAVNQNINNAPSNNKILDYDEWIRSQQDNGQRRDDTIEFRDLENDQY